MKRFLLLCSVLILFTAFKCDNEPLEGEFSTVEAESCNASIQNVINAALAFSEATEETYEQLCGDYKTTIQFQIQFCGDPDGSLQALLNSIGPCATDNEVDDCAEAAAAVGVAQAAFTEATSETYTELCNIYRETLLTLIEFCGPDGGTTSVLEDLGNCMEEATGEGIISVNVGTAPIVFDVINVFQIGEVLQVAAETGSPMYYIIYFEIALGETGVDIINDTFSITLNSQFLPSTQGFDDFTSTITSNTPGNIIGTFNGIVTNADGGDLSLTSGVISVSY